MTIAQVSAAVVSLVTTFVNGFSFSELTGILAPSPAHESVERSTTADLPTDQEERIYGGSNAEIVKYPYMAGLRANGPDDETFCGGTLIAPQYVLTSAYCLEGDMILFDVYASLGTQRSAGRGSRKAEQICVVEAFRHPLYNDSWLTYDVALLKLEKPSTHQPARLCAADGSDNEPGTMATVLGWGMLNNETYAETLQRVDVQVTSDTECANYTIDTEVHMCAGNGHGKDFCAGDIGGPLVANDVLIGVAAGIPGAPTDCGELPALYTRVAHVLDYINDILNGGSSGNATEILTAGVDVMKFLETAQ